MLINYFKIALRNILRNRTYSVINILGLTIGITAAVMIMLFVRYHLRFDEHISNIDNKYRVVEIQQAQGVGEQHVAITMGPLARRMEQDFPEVKQACRVMTWSSEVFTYGEESYNIYNFAFADSNVFDMLGIKMLYGDPATALANKGSMCISESTAKKVFSSAEAATGKMISYGPHGTFKITGVFQDAPEQSHYKYNVMVDFKTAEDNFSSMSSWTSNSMTTYVEFKNEADMDAFGEKFREYLLPHAPEDVPEENVYRLYLQNVGDIHLHSGHIKYQYNRNMGNGMFIFILGLVGVLLITIASINYINLSIARSVKRSREVGMRKVLGATRQKLINQFLGESLMITFISIILSMVAAELLIPEFNALMNTDLQLSLSPLFLSYLLIILLVVSIVSGSYPAFYLSRYNPATVLKGDTEKGISSTTLTKILVGFQFFISTVLIFFIIITSEQMGFIKSKDLGINYENVINLDLSSNSRKHSRIQAYKDELIQNSIIEGASLTTALSGAGGSQSTVSLNDTSETSVMVRVCLVDKDFLPLMDVPVVKGRNFSSNYAMDTVSSMIINEALADYLGWENPVGKRFNPFMSDTVRKVIGMVHDYHYYDLYAKIEPAIFIYSPSMLNEMNIKVSGANSDRAMTLLEEKWNEFFPGQPFNANFAEREVMARYGSVEQTIRLFSVFVLISLLISSLGLFGLSSLYVERKTREIAIRKVLGGTAYDINMMIVRDFIILIGIAGLISIPAGYKLAERYLQEFAYHVDIAWYYFAAAIAISLILGIGTVLIKSMRAANTNPVDTLKYE